MINKFRYQDYQKLLGNRIKQYRINAEMSQQDLENESGVSVSQYFQIGTRCFCSAGKFNKNFNGA